jgi:hypothetical protein
MAGEALPRGREEKVLRDTGTALAYLYPEAVYGLHYEVEDGEITLWDAAALGPPPTEERMEAALVPALRRRRQAELAAMGLSRLEGVFQNDFERDEIAGLTVVMLREAFKLLEKVTGQTIPFDPRLEKLATVLVTAEHARAYVEALPAEATEEQVEAAVEEAKAMLGRVP